MNILDVQQGSAEWLAARAQHFTASEAPAALGVSKYQTRSDLLRQKATGIAADVDAGKQALFDKGHESEAAGRPMAEEIVGDLYPVTATLNVDGLRLLASLDGATMMEDEIFEHKLYSQSLAAQVAAGALEPHYTVQMDQQLLVSGARRCLFMTSDGTRERMAWCWYETTPEKIAALIAGWKQFAADLATYVPPAVAEPAAVGKSPDLLPALQISVHGAVTGSNLAEFKSTALAAIRSVNRELVTDQHFADADKAVKWCEDVESRLEAAKLHALSQTASIEALFRAMDEIAEESKTVRLALTRLIKDRKEARKGEIVAGGIAALAQHVANLNVAIGRPLMPAIPADFAAAVKGKRSFESMQDAVDTVLAGAKISANATRERIGANLQALEKAEHSSLFPDMAALVLKAPDDLAAVIEIRIAKHKADEAEKQARAQQAVAAPTPAVVQQAPASVASPVATAFAAPRAPAANEPATLKLGTLCERLGFTMTAAFVAERLGIEPAATDKAAKLYRESDFARICAALLSHVGAMRVMHAKGERQEVAA